MDPIYEDQDQIVQPEASPWPTGFRYGLFGGLISIAYGLLAYLFGITENAMESGGSDWLSTLVGLAISIGAIFLAIKYYRDQELNGRISFGRAFGVGAIVALVMAVITGIWIFVFFGVVDPGMLDAITEQSALQMEEQGLSDQEIEQAMGYTQMFMNPTVFAIFGSIFSFISGAIIALIMGAIMKRD